MRRNTVLILFGFFTAIALVAVGCKQNQEVAEDKTAVEERQSEVAKVEIITGERSPAFPDAKARFNKINNGDVLEDNNVAVIVDVWNYELFGCGKSSPAVW